MANKSDTVDELAIAIGHALSAWTSVEMALADLFEQVSGLPTVKAHILMASIVSFDARMAVCNALMNDSDDFRDVLPLWHKVGERILKGYKSRHQIAHFSFLGNEQGVSISPYFSIGNAFLGKTKNLGVAEISHKRERFDELKTAVYWFVMRHKTRNMQTKIELKSDLIRRLQNSDDQSLEAK